MCEHESVGTIVPMYTDDHRMGPTTEDTLNNHRHILCVSVNLFPCPELS